MLECPACKASYPKEVNSCKQCNLSEDNIHYINEISPDNPIFNCIAFLVEKSKKLEKSNCQQQMQLSLSDLYKKVNILKNQQKESNQKQEKNDQILEELKKRVFELESHRQSQDNYQNINRQTEFEISINSQSKNLIEDKQNNYNIQDIGKTKEHNGNNDNIVTLQNEELLNNNHDNVSNLPKDISDNETDESNVLQITDERIYQFIETYNRDKNLFDEYAISTVIETKESRDNRLAGCSEKVFLSSTNKGNYWIVEENNNFYLVPQAKISINEHNKRYTIENLFECNESSSGDYSFKLIRPAEVLKIDLEKWQLKEKGQLEFD